MIIKLSPEDIKRYNLMIWKIVGGCFVFMVLLLFATYFGLFGAIPSFRDLENPKSNQATEIISADKQTLGTYYVQNRLNVRFKDISPNVIHALVATEDTRFYQHSGIDFQRMVSIVFLNIFKKQGGSTITQQLALNLFNDKGRAHNKIVRLTQKVKEWITAVQLEKHYTKDEIVTMYLNTVDFGAYNTFGIKSASLTYFNTTPDKLTPDQAALLVGMINGPGLFSPVKHPQNALNRRNKVVLPAMAKMGFLSQGQLKDFQRKPLGLHLHQVDYNDGPAPYFRAALKKEVMGILEEQSNKKADGTPYDIDRDGLKIYTTIDSRVQQYAEEAQREYMRILQVQFDKHMKGYSLWKNIKNFKEILNNGMHLSDRYKEDVAEGKSEKEITDDFNTPTEMQLFTWHGDTTLTMKPIDSIVYCKLMLRNAVMSMDPGTGYVKAWVGGTSFKHFKYDQVKTGTRQVGSTAKPFTYTVALQGGYSPCTKVDNVPDTIRGFGAKPWCPASPDTKPGMLTLRDALAFSQNWITAHIMKEVTPQPVADLIKKMGITSDVPAYPSICIGSFDASVYDMTGAYSIYANHGVWTEPTYLLRIEDKNGNVLYMHTPKVTPVLSPDVAYVMTYMLKGVVEEGTGIRLRTKYGLNNPIGGKTGTPNDNSDGWFIGITPQLVTSVWTGCEDPEIHFRTLALGEGANTALPIFGIMMNKVYADPSLGIKKNVDFDKPASGLNITLDCAAYDQQQASNPTTAVKH